MNNPRRDRANPGFLPRGLIENRSADIYPAGQVDSREGQQTDRQTRGMLTMFWCILDELTLERFAELTKQVDELSINDEERLKAVVDLIVYKAVFKSIDSTAHAKMCHHLKGVTVTSQSSNGTTCFHSVLLTKCQMEFGNILRDSELLKEKENKMAAAQAEDERQQLKQELEQTKQKAWKHSLGTVRFISELFKLNMVSEGIMHICAVKLLEDRQENSLECLCKMLSVVGADLEAEAGRPKLDSYFDTISQVVKERRTSTRIGSMLLDLLELRKNNWVPCKKEESPNTIGNFPKEVKQVGEREQLQLGGEQNAKQVILPDKRRKKREDQPRYDSRIIVEQRKLRKQTDKKTETEDKMSRNLRLAPIKDEQVQDCNEEVSMALKRLLQQKANNREIEEWIQDNLNARQRSSDEFIRALMRSVCQSVIVPAGGFHKLDARRMFQRVELLKKHIRDDQKQLVALNALHQLVVSMKHADCLLRMFFDILLDEDVIQDELFFNLESSTLGSASLLSSFFAWLREAEQLC